MYYSIRKCSFSISPQKIDTFRIFYAKLDIPFSVNGSIGRRNEIMFGGHYNDQIRYVKTMARNKKMLCVQNIIS